MTQQPTINPWDYHLQQIQNYFDSRDAQHQKNLLALIKTTEISFKQGKIKVSPLTTELALKKFITQDPKMLEMKNQVRQLATENYPVLIQGETGTGKELIANALHGWREGKFVAINCTSLPDTLLESEMFGHKKGAFTGADNDKIGLFQHANQGTLFLDEIGDMPLNLQTKLLRVLQEKKIRRVGDNDHIDINCRIIAATNQDLYKGIQEKRFREDLYWRLNTFKIEISPLRTRHNDIRLILEELDETFPLDFPEYKSEYLGNVRELEAMVARWKVFKKI